MSILQKSRLTEPARTIAYNWGEPAMKLILRDPDSPNHEHVFSRRQAAKELKRGSISQNWPARRVHEKYWTTLGGLLPIDKVLDWDAAIRVMSLNENEKEERGSTGRLSTRLRELLRFPLGRPCPMSRAQFHALLQDSIADISHKNHAHRLGWHLGEEVSWETESWRPGPLGFGEHDVLTLRFKGGRVAKCTGSIVATYALQSSVWRWAWKDYHSEVGSDMVRRYGVAHFIPLLTAQFVHCSELQAWQLTALSARICGSEGAYQAQGSSDVSFVVFSEVQLC